MRAYYESPDGIAIYCGDCREVLPAVAPSVPYLLLTDPPYGIRSVRTDGKMGGSVAAENKVYLPVHGDDKPMDIAWLGAFGARQIIWGADHFAGGIPKGGRLLVWDKRDGMRSNDFADCEIAWDSAPGPCRIVRHRQLGMIHDGYGDIGRVHPNQKPLKVMAWCLAMAPGTRVVVDAYMGSGTTLRAARQAGVRAIGIEIEERYCEIAARRLQQGVLDFGEGAAS